MFASNTMKERLKEREISTENIEGKIHPAYFDTFYGDGLYLNRNSDDNTLEYETSAYVIPHN